MLAYQFTPQVMEDSALTFSKRRSIAFGKIVTLNFLADAEEGVHKY